MKATTFKEFVYGTIQGIILIGVTYVTGTFVYSKMMKKILNYEED